MRVQHAITTADGTTFRATTGSPEELLAPSGTVATIEIGGYLFHASREKVQAIARLAAIVALDMESEVRPC